MFNDAGKAENLGSSLGGQTPFGTASHCRRHHCNTKIKISNSATSSQTPTTPASNSLKRASPADLVEARGGSLSFSFPAAHTSAAESAGIGAVSSATIAA